MIKTKLICSYKYIKRLNQKFSEEDWEKMIKISQEFNKLYEEKTPVVLERIPFYTGFYWENTSKEIEIYLADFKGPSRTNPITIKTGKINEMMLKLIHELTHTNIPLNKLEISSSLIYEDIINQVTTEVSKDIELNAPLEKIIEFRNDLLERKENILKIPLSFVNVRNYLNINSRFTKW